MGQLTAERLRQLVEYDAETGVFTRRGRPRVKAGKVCGHTKPDGRVLICVDGADYRAHRLAWLYMTGEWPIGEIDHRDGNPSNNAFANLRQVDSSTNKENARRPRSDNKTGLLGVFKHTQYDKFCAQIRVKGKRMHLGVFDDPQTAHAAYIAAKRRLHQGNTL